MAYRKCAYYHGGHRLRSFVVGMGNCSAWLDRRDFDFDHFLFRHLFHFYDACRLLPCAGSRHRKTKLHLHGRCSILPRYVFLFISLFLPFLAKVEKKKIDALFSPTLFSCSKKVLYEIYFFVNIFFVYFEGLVLLRYSTLCGIYLARMMLVGRIIVVGEISNF